MVRKEDGWYFKSGEHAGILKLKGNLTPDDVIWTQYYVDHAINRCVIAIEDEYGNEFNFYDSEIQYMVIPKMPLRIQ